MVAEGEMSQQASEIDDAVLLVQAGRLHPRRVDKPVKCEGDGRGDVSTIFDTACRPTTWRTNAARCSRSSFAVHGNRTLCCVATRKMGAMHNDSALYRSACCAERCKLRVA